MPFKLLPSCSLHYLFPLSIQSPLTLPAFPYSPLPLPVSHAPTYLPIPPFPWFSFPFPLAPSRTPQADPPHPLIMRLLRAIHSIVNSTRPDLGPSCWLCMDAQPPYYVGVAVNGSGSHSPDSENCRWEQPKLTLGDVQGKGTCLTSSTTSLKTSPYSPVCNSTVVVPQSSSSFYSGPSGTWWACLDGITQCVSAAVFLKESEPLCILVFIIPRVSLLQGLEGWEYFSHEGSVSY